MRLTVATLSGFRGLISGALRRTSTPLRITRSYRRHDAHEAKCAVTAARAVGDIRSSRYSEYSRMKAWQLIWG